MLMLKLNAPRLPLIPIHTFTLFNNSLNGRIKSSTQILPVKASAAAETQSVGWSPAGNSGEKIG
ncbi:hypothetical protein [Bradyrhizobium sp. F1.13.3]|uniref:hypothetical protein n=1 Tax=Bradyrhizobium sp. F1.13.3 TaxID=3156351 RepID=UPI003395D2F8